VKTPSLLLAALAALLLTSAVPARATHHSDADVVGHRSSGRSHGSGLYGVRWNPCAPITFEIRSRGGYPGSSQDVRRAVRTLARATGISFAEVHRGEPDISWEWTTARKNSNLRGSVVGAMSTMSIEHDGVNETTGGWIDLDSSAHLRHGFPASGAPAWGQVFLHELGHVLGLAHVPGRNQVMNAVTSSANHVLGRGDRARLHRVGRAAGCVRHSAR
jgi:hypothetical protein